jgi:hypothetical protein
MREADGIIGIVLDTAYFAIGVEDESENRQINWNLLFFFDSFDFSNKYPMRFPFTIPVNRINCRF